MHADLAGLDLGRTFDVVALAGNVVPYVAEADRAAAVAGCARHVGGNGRLVAGFQLAGGWPTVAEYDEWCAAAGLELESRFADLGRGSRSAPTPTYAVSVHRWPDTPGRTTTATPNPPTSRSTTGSPTPSAGLHPDAEPEHAARIATAPGRQRAKWNQQGAGGVSTVGSTGVGPPPARSTDVGDGMHEPDASLVRSASAGDRRAFEQLVRECQGPVRRYLRHLVGDDARADDLTQEVLVKVHAQLHAYRFESRFMTWLFRIARNAVHDDRRVRAAPAGPRGAGLHRAALARSRPWPARSRPPWPRLPVALREALLLVEVCGFTYAEVGQLVGVPEGTVKSRVHRAREGVARWYAGAEVEQR